MPGQYTNPVDLVFSQPPVSGMPLDLVFGQTDVVAPQPILASVQATLANTLAAAMLAGPVVPGSTAGSVDLVFSQQPNTGMPLDLVFGLTDAALLPPILARAQATLANTLSAAFVAAPPTLVAAFAQLANTLVVTAAAVYDNRVTHWLDVRPAAPHNRAVSSTSQASSGWAISTSQRAAPPLAWHVATAKRASITAPADTAYPMLLAAGAPWALAAAQHVAAASAFQKAVAQTVFTAGSFAQAQRRAVQAVAPLQAGIFKAYYRSAAWQAGILWQRPINALAGASLFISAVSAAARWQTATGARPGLPVLPPLPPIVITGDLLFECPALGSMPLELVFGAHPCGGLQQAAFYSINPARFYMTTHYLMAELVSNGAAVPLYDCTLSADVGSFAWQFSASGPESLFAQLAPAAGPGTALPQLLQITLDGLRWVFLVESLKRAHTFGKRSVSISGRSQTALVGAPWLRDAAFNNLGAATAQQLAGQAVDLSGVAVDWGITDWLVPADAWSFNGSVLAAVQAIAEAAGGYLQSHRSAPTLQVRHPYPPRPDGSTGGPWNWGTGAADVALAPDAIITSAIDRRDGADINAVYVSGTSQGVLALIKRAGTAGDKLAAMQTNGLITAADAAQQRGLATLGKAGPQHAISLELPVLTGAGQPGVIDVGSLVQVNDATIWRGRVRSVSVNAAMPTARQTITLERHL